MLILYGLEMISADVPLSMSVSVDWTVGEVVFCAVERTHLSFVASTYMYMWGYVRIFMKPMNVQC